MMMYFFGLGNPGQEYQFSRHNVGFQLLDVLAEELHTPDFQFQPRFFAEITKQNQLFLVKPQTYMNDSGKAAQALLHFYKEEVPAGCELRNVFVVHDDLDLPIGQSKIQFGKGPKGHNGLLSLYDHLHTQLFWHVRIGVDGRGGDRSQESAAYVLSGFSPTEKIELKTVFSSTIGQLLGLLQGEKMATMVI